MEVLPNGGFGLARAEQAGGARLAGPSDAGADGRLAVLADATGVPLCLWQARRRVGAELVDEPNAWAMSSLHSTDPERAQAFYAAVFGWELEPAPGVPFTHWRLADEVVAVLTATDGVAVPPHRSVNFAVRDADAIVEHAADSGGTILMAPINTPGFRSAVIADPRAEWSRSARSFPEGDPGRAAARVHRPAVALVRSCADGVPVADPPTRRSHGCRRRLRPQRATGSVKLSNHRSSDIVSREPSC